MLKCNPSKFLQHNAGGYRTDWHYRTSHLLKDILAAGDDYWLPIVNLLRVGDEIIVESDQMSWRYWLSVRMATMVPVPRVAVRLLNPLDIANGVQVFDKETEREKEKVLKEEQEREEEAVKLEAERRAKILENEQEPFVKWVSPPRKWGVVAYGRVAQADYGSKEEAQAALDNGDLTDEIAVNLDVFLKERERELRAA